MDSLISMTGRSFFLDQHGCAKNQVDGEQLVSILLRAGWVNAENPETADLIIINSCGFIESAKKESLDAVFSARKSYPSARILLAGCLAERYGKDFADSLPEADGFFGNGDLSRLPAVVEPLFAGKRPVLLPPQRGVCCTDRSEFFSFAGSAYVKITEGCDNRCSFCAIPLIRGSLRSRPVGDIVAEVRQLLDRGVFEINLVGQDLASYGMEMDTAAFGGKTLPVSDGVQNQISPLAFLLSRLRSLEGRFWIRLLYIHPDNFKEDILAQLSRDSRLLPYFDIPFQSGDSDIIRAMNRRGSPQSYQALVDRIRTVLPETVLRTTFLSGFPGETDVQFQNTRMFLERIRPYWSGCFEYSREEGTAAERIKPSVPRKVALARKKLLQEVQERITAECLASHVDSVTDVLLEELIPVSEEAAEPTAFALGRAWFQAPEVDGSVVVSYDAGDADQAALMREGAVIRVRITGVSGVDLTAVPEQG